MMINSNILVSITESNQNFSKVARLVDEQDSAVILKNNVPRYFVVEFSQADDRICVDGEPSTRAYFISTSRVFTFLVNTLFYCKNSGQNIFCVLLHRLQLAFHFSSMNIPITWAPRHSRGVKLCHPPLQLAA